MNRRLATLAVIGQVAATACGEAPLRPGGDENGENGGNGTEVVAFQEVAAGLASPVHVAAPAGDTRLFVVEQGGRIRILENGTVLPEPFLDIRDQVSSGGERGLLSVAFHPQYATNGRFFVSYTDQQGDSRIERYTVSDDPGRADPASAALVLHVPQPFANHNGGYIEFGPDGMLYIGLGDGGGAGDPHGNGQDPNTLLGALLRIDVDSDEPYAIPLDNPFVHGGGLPEIWAIGLRNPWRFHIDPETGLLYIADVGQARFEEINVEMAHIPGLNYGWNVMEGRECYPSGSSCPREGLVEPVLVYGHDGGRCSVTGGLVYRGEDVPALRGYYLYADYCDGAVHAFRYASDSAMDQRRLSDSLGRVTSFGQDGRNELYVVTAEGRLFRMVRP